MKLNKILIISTLLLLTGCTVNYNLEIKEDGVFNETITGTVTNEELENENRTDTNPYIDNLNSSTPLIRDEGSYTKNITDKDGYKEFKYSYKFKNNYDKSSVINSCFENKVFNETNDLYYINLSGKFDCLHSDKIVINVTSEYAILENNAKKVKDNVYTWEIDSKENVEIYIAISKNIKVKNNIDKKRSNTFRIIGLIVLVVLSTVTYFLYKKKNNNEI